MHQKIGRRITENQTEKSDRQTDFDSVKQHFDIGWAAKKTCEMAYSEIRIKQT